jgi:hypothetical protein
MTGDGLGSDGPARRRPRALPCPRTHCWGTLVTLGVGAGDPEAAAAAPDRLSGADMVFAAGAAEATVLFYAEAWRVERVGSDPVGTLAAWFAAQPGSTAVFAAPGEPAVFLDLDELRERLPGVDIEQVSGEVLVPPELHPLDREPGPRGWALE